MNNSAVASLVVVAILAGITAGYFFGTNTIPAGSSATWTAVCSISGVKLPPQNSSVPLQVVSLGADCENGYSNIVQFSMTLKNTSNRTVVLSGYAGPDLDGAISYKILSGNTTLQVTRNGYWCTVSFSYAEEPPGTQLTFVTGGCSDPNLLEAIAPGIATVQFTIRWAEPPSPSYLTIPSIPLTMIANLTVAKS